MWHVSISEIECERGLTSQYSVDRAETGISGQDQDRAQTRTPGQSTDRAQAEPGQSTDIPQIDCEEREGLLPAESYQLEELRQELQKQQRVAQSAQRAAERANISLKRVRREKAALQKKKKNMDNKLSKVFTEDQIKALGRGNTRGMRWSNNTIKKALQIRFAAGPTGYKTLLDLQIPLPAIRTLQRRLQRVKFEPGILEEVFAFLKLKAAGMSELERECVLTLDEMAITPSVELHMGSGQLYGDVTLPLHTGPATHALVFMLAGTTTRWKQVVAFHYSGNSTQGTVYKPITLDIIRRAAAIGLHVISVTTDMGSPKRAMWKAFGVDHNTTCVPHPLTPDRQLFFMPDVPHLVKNLRNALVHGHTLTLPNEVVEKNNLPSNQVSLDHIKDLISFQEGMALKIAPNLSRKSIELTHFEKMKVGPAMNLFSHSTSAGLKYMVQKEGRPQYHLTTAWFLEQVNHWFDLMSSRHPSMALSRLKMEEYEKAKVFLNDMVHLFCKIKIGTGGWKPIQTGVVMATRSILAIQEEMLARGHKFVLTARFTQDCLENVFSCVRYRNPAPTPVEFHQALRLISVGQFLTTVKSGSYQDDDNNFLVDFLDTVEPTEMTRVRVRVEELLEDRAASDSEFTKTEKNVLFFLAGYIAHKVNKYGKICNDCKTAVTDSECASVAEEDSTLLALKEYKSGALCRPSPEVLDLVHQVEHLFRRNRNCMKLQNAVGFLERESLAFTSLLPSCHGVHQKIIKRFIRLRLRIESKKIRDERKKVKSGHHGSKSQTKKANRNGSSLAASTAPVISKPPTAPRLSNTLLVAMEAVGIPVVHPNTATPVSLISAPSSSTHPSSMPPPHHSSKQHSSAQEFTSQTLSAQTHGGPFCK